MKFIYKIWNYFRNSWEGDDGQASSKKLTLLAVTANFLVYTWFVRDRVTLYVFFTLAGVSILNSGLITFANLATLLKFTLPAMGKNEKNEPQNEELPPEMVKDIIEQKT